jgi:hypothetical protein
VGTVDGDSGRDELEQHLPLAVVGREAFDGPEQHGMVSDDQPRLTLDCFACDIRGQRQARQDPRRLALAVSRQEAHIVPLFGEIEGREAPEKVYEIGYARHGDASGKDSGIRIRDSGFRDSVPSAIVHGYRILSFARVALDPPYFTLNRFGTSVDEEGILNHRGTEDTEKES